MGVLLKKKLIKPDFCITPLSWYLCPTIVFLFSLNQTTRLSKRGSTLGSHIKSWEGSGVKLAKETLVLMGLAICHLSFFFPSSSPSGYTPFFSPTFPSFAVSHKHTPPFPLYAYLFVSFFFFTTEVAKSSLFSVPLVHLTVSILTSDLIFLIDLLPISA